MGRGRGHATGERVYTYHRIYVVRATGTPACSVLPSDLWPTTPV